MGTVQSTMVRYKVRQQTAVVAEPCNCLSVANLCHNIPTITKQPYRKGNGNTKQGVILLAMA